MSLEERIAMDRNEMILESCRKDTTAELITPLPTDNGGPWYAPTRAAVVTVLEERGVLTSEQAALLRVETVRFWKVLKRMTEKHDKN